MQVTAPFENRRKQEMEPKIHATTSTEKWVDCLKQSKREAVVGKGTGTSLYKKRRGKAADE
jgi:hypothetical protein